MSHRPLVLILLVALIGCTTAVPRIDKSASLIRERYQVSGDHFEFGCAFAFQSSIEHYLKDEINGLWLPGTCIVDTGLGQLLVGHEAADRPSNTPSRLVTSIPLKSFSSINSKTRGTYAQFQFGSKETLPGQWSDVTYPKSRLVLNTNIRNFENLSQRLIKSGFSIGQSSVEIKQKSKEPEANFDGIFILPKTTR